MMFEELPKKHFRAILADPPWRWEAWGSQTNSQTRGPPYQLMDANDLQHMPVSDLAADDCVLFLWVTWPMLEAGMSLITHWRFVYKTCAFAWMKANGKQIDMFNDEIEPDMRMGYWTRSNSEVCLLATRGKPKRINADVRQGFIEPVRQHSRKPSGVHSRIERLVAGPYLELFAREKREGWTVWGNETDKFKPKVELEVVNG